MAGTNALGVGVADAWDYLGRDYFSGRVPALAFGSCAVHLDELREINTIFNGVGHSRAIRSKAVRSQLELPGSSQPQAFNKNVRAGLIAFADSEVEHQLGFAF